MPYAPSVLDRGYGNFLKLRYGEVRRTHLPRRWVNSALGTGPEQPGWGF